MTDIEKCEICGESMPQDETMFKFHGYSGPCPKPPIYQQRVLLEEAKPKEKTKNVIDQITAEVARATVKFPTWPTDPLHALAVLGEEFGELTKAMLQHTYEPHKGVTEQDIREEAIQTAAMALRLAMSLGSYEYRRGEQHKQSSEGDRFIGRDVRELEALAAKGLREDGLPD